MIIAVIRSVCTVCSVLFLRVTINLKKNCQQILRECVVYYVLMFRMQSCDTKIIKLTTLL